MVDLQVALVVKELLASQAWNGKCKSALSLRETSKNESPSKSGVVSVERHREARQYSEMVKRGAVNPNRPSMQSMGNALRGAARRRAWRPCS